MGKSSYRPPDHIELIRMNLKVLETAAAAGDVGTARASIDAAEGVMRGLRDVLGSQGVEVGPATVPVPPDVARREIQEAWEPVRAGAAAMAREAMRPPAVPDVGIRQDLIEARRESAAWRHAFEVLEPVDAWLRDVHARRWKWGTLARLAWAFVRCAAALIFRGLRRGR